MSISNLSDQAPSSKWVLRDVPFLRVAAVRLDESSRNFKATDLAETTGLSAEECIQAARALMTSRHLEGNPLGSLQGLSNVILTDVTERGRRATGLWPPEETVEALTDALREVAERTSDTEQASRLRRVADAVGGMSRDVAVEVAAALSTRMMGM